MPGDGSARGKIRSRFVRKSAKPGAKRKPSVILVLGSKSIGKTCLIKRYIEGKFIEIQSPTVEDRFAYDIKQDNNELHCEIVEINPFDFPAERDLHVKDAYVIMLVYEVRNRKSFEIMQKIYESIKDVRENAVPLIVVATKCDKLNSNEMMGEEKEGYIDEYILDLNASRFADGVRHINTSAKLGYNVSEAFKYAFSEIIKIRNSELFSPHPELSEDSQGSGCSCAIL